MQKLLEFLFPVCHNKMMQEAEWVQNEYGAEVLDTKRAFSDRLKSKKVTLITVASGAWTLLCIFYLPEYLLISNLGFFIVGFPWLALALWAMALYSGLRTAFWKQLALKYGWEYTATRRVSDEKALLFTVGNSQDASHGINGDYNGHPFYVFEYEYTIGKGDNKRTYAFTVFEVKFQGTFPHLYLNYKGDWYSNRPSMFSSLANISVPREFENIFKLYAPKEYEIETLQIFTPDVFALLIDSKWSHDMEFVNGELIIYSNKKFTNFTNLDAELSKVKKFIDILGPLLNRLKLTQIGNISPSLD